MLKAYFDESGREGGVFCVAGFVFAPAQAKKFRREWSQLFPEGGHMTDLVARKKQFRGISHAKREELIIEAIEIINRRRLMGLALSCQMEEVMAQTPRFIRGFGHAYPMLCQLAMLGVSTHLSQLGLSESVYHVFEAGNEHQAEADDFLGLIASTPELRQQYAYAGHAFLQKGDALPLQAADLLAWEWTKYKDETVDKRLRLMRLSLVSLLTSRGGLRYYRLGMLGGEKLARYLQEHRKMGIAQLKENEESQIAREAERELRRNAKEAKSRVSELQQLDDRTDQSTAFTGESAVGCGEESKEEED